MGEWNGVQLMVLRRSRGDREIVEVWMDGRIECRVLRRSRGIVEIAEAEVCAEVEVWRGWRMEFPSILPQSSSNPAVPHLLLLHLIPIFPASLGFRFVSST